MQKSHFELLFFVSDTNLDEVTQGSSIGFENPFEDVRDDFKQGILWHLIQAWRTFVRGRHRSLLLGKSDIKQDSVCGTGIL